MQGLTETMPKTRSLHSLADGHVTNSRYRFKEGHLDFLTDKRGETRETSGFGTLEGKCVGLCKIYRTMIKGRGSVRNKGGKKETIFYCEVDQGLKHVTQGCCGAFEDTQNLSGHGPG